MGHQTHLGQLGFADAFADGGKRHAEANGHLLLVAKERVDDGGAVPALAPEQRASKYE